MERYSLPLGAWDGLRYFIVALPEHSIYLFYKFFFYRLALLLKVQHAQNMCICFALPAIHIVELIAILKLIYKFLVLCILDTKRIRDDKKARGKSIQTVNRDPQTHGHGGLKHCRREPKSVFSSANSKDVLKFI